MTRFSTLKKEWMKEPGFKKGYDALAPEFELASALIAARRKAKMTQADVAARMETTQSVIARLESGKQKPTLDTLKRYADATNTRLKIQFVSP